jgi:predicted ester cyclase
MSLQDDNKAVVGRWFTEFWGNPWKPGVVDELAAPDICFEYSPHQPLRGRAAVKEFATNFRAAFPDLKFWGTAELIADGNYVVGQWEGGGTHTGIAFDDLPIGSLGAASGKSMRFTGTTVLRLADGLIIEERGLDDGVAVLQQLGVIPTGAK